MHDWALHVPVPSMGIVGVVLVTVGVLCAHCQPGMRVVPRFREHGRRVRGHLWVHVWVPTHLMGHMVVVVVMVVG